MSETTIAVGIAAAILAGMFAWALLLDVLLPLSGRRAQRFGADSGSLREEAGRTGATRRKAERPEDRSARSCGVR